MRVRFTESAARDFNQNVGYLREHAPAVVGDFADSVEKAIDELIEHPYSAQETTYPGVRRKYIRRFRHSIFYVVDQEADELVILYVRHAVRQWPWLDENSLRIDR